jgi:hypothetical protein
VTCPDEVFGKGRVSSILEDERGTSAHAQVIDQRCWVGISECEAGDVGHMP